MERAGLIPIVDLSPMRGNDERAKKSLAGEIDQAFTTVGFCYAVNHGVPQQIIDTAFTAAARFYALPVAQKNKVAVNNLFRGYSGLDDELRSYNEYNSDGTPSEAGAKSTSGGKEMFNLSLEVAEGDSDPQPDGWTYGPNNWPDADMPEFRRAIYPYFEAVCRAGDDLLRAVSLALGVSEDFFLGKYTRNTGQCTVLHYPPLDAAAVAAGIESSTAHCDFSCITLLYQDNVGGLQVQERATKKWVDATPIAGAFVINVGDMLARWTNHRYVSTPHRVMNTSGRQRYSIGTFYNPSATAVVDPRELGIGEKDCLYPPVQAGKYVRARFDELFASAGK